MRLVGPVSSPLMRPESMQSAKSRKGGKFGDAAPSPYRPLTRLGHLVREIRQEDRARRSRKRAEPAAAGQGTSRGVQSFQANVNFVSWRSQRVQPVQRPYREAMRQFYLRLAGVKHSNADGVKRQSIIKRCTVGEELRLVPEPDNPFDSSAIRVCRLNGETIGYIKSGDNKHFPHQCRVSIGSIDKAEGHRTLGIGLLVTVE